MLETRIKNLEKALSNELARNHVYMFVTHGNIKELFYSEEEEREYTEAMLRENPYFIEFNEENVKQWRTKKD